ncbi:MAG: hypothetical protein C4518_19735 [Desulfobacteraceae bacterium]|nr:MAG: hypothetical protein C4518_19735 [Desulfobacteraceae bacterium]
MERIKQIFIVIIVGFCFSCAQKEGGPGMLWQISPEKSLYDSSEAHYQAGEYNDALSGFQSYLSQFPDTPLAPASRLRVGMIRSFKRQYEKAQKDFQRVIADYPDTPYARDARVELLDAWYNTGNYHQVTVSAGNVLAQPLTVKQVYRANLIIGDAYMALKSSRDAYYAYLIAFQVASEREAGKAISKLKTALALMETSDLSAELDKLAGRPPSDYLMYQLGVNYMKDGNADDAKATLTAFAAQFPHHENADQAQKLIAEMDSPKAVARHVNVIGCLLPMTGKYETFGQQAYTGIEYALSRFVQSQDGNAIKILLKDTGSDPQKTREAVKELADSNVSAIIGPIGTVDEAALSAQGFNIPIITMTQKDGITDIGDSVFRNFLTPRMQVKALVSYTVGTLGLKRFAILYPSENYGNTHMNGFRDEVVAAGGTVSGAEAYPPGQTDFANAIKKLAGPQWVAAQSMKKTSASSPLTANESEAPEAAPPEPTVDFDAIFIPDSPDKAGLIIPQLAYYGVADVYLLGTNLWHSDKLIQMAKYNVQNAIIPDGFFAQSTSEHVRQFVSGFRGAYGSSPGFIEAVSYDTAMMVFELAARPDIRERSDIRRELLVMPPFEGVTGKTVFDENREAVKDIYLLKIFQGGFQEVTVRYPDGGFQ